MKAGKADSTKCTRRDANNTKGTQQVQTGTQKSTTDRANTKNRNAKSTKATQNNAKVTQKGTKVTQKSTKRGSATRSDPNNIGPLDPDISQYAL